jgi:hypothetical protein
MRNEFTLTEVSNLTVASFLPIPEDSLRVSIAIGKELYSLSVTAKVDIPKIAF